eukprot:5747345-Pyramimonas_sp.AAC.1
MGNVAQQGEPPSIGAWPAEDTVLLWGQLPTHRESWPLTLVFNGRVLTRFSHGICQGGTLVSREVPRFTDIDRAVALVKVSDWMGPNGNKVFWSIVFNHEWASYEVNFDNNSTLGWIHTDETLSLIPGHMPQLPPEATAFVQSVPWGGDGRFLCANLHW